MMTVREHQELSDEYLGEFYAAAREDEVAARARRENLEAEIIMRMEERGAKALPHPIYIIELEQTYRYDQQAFTPLKEILLPTDLKECWTPSYEETIRHAESWNTQKTLAIVRRYSAGALAITERAKQPNTPRLKFAERREKKA